MICITIKITALTIQQKNLLKLILYIQATSNMQV